MYERKAVPLVYERNPVVVLFRDVAQFGSASALGAEGRRFKSCRPDSATVSVMTGMGVWLRRLERLADNEKVGGSSPSTPTSGHQEQSWWPHFMPHWSSGLGRLVLSQEIAGSNPAWGTAWVFGVIR